MRYLAAVALVLFLAGCAGQDIAKEYVTCLARCDHQTTFKDEQGCPVGLLEVRERVVYVYGQTQGKAVRCEPVDWDSEASWKAARIAAGTPLNWVAVDPKTGKPNTPPWLRGTECTR